MADTRPPPKNLEHHLSRNAASRKASSIKAFYKYFSIPGIGQLAGGLPNNYYFPFDTLEARVARPARWEPTPNKPIDPPSIASTTRGLGRASLKDEGSPLHQPQDSLKVPHKSDVINPIKRIDLSTALQYGQAQGYPSLYYFIRQFCQEHLHVNCPYQGGPEVILTCGNTDGFSKVLQVLTNEWSAERDWVRDRDALLVEEFVYMNAVQAAAPRGLAIAPVKLDDEGMRVDGPGGLRDVLENWDLSKGRRPRLMYTVTMGQNPTSGVLSLARRREIYALCVKYDIIVVEDDPYWYLQFPTSTSATSSTPKMSTFVNNEPHPEGWKLSGYPFLDSLVPSFISIDTDGRVLRLDTFSKTVAPGCRLGWITGQPALIERILRITETSTQQPSGFVQAMIAELLLGPDHAGLDVAKSGKGGRGGLSVGQGWKADGWVRWLEGLRGNYERRMNRMCQILEDGKYLVKSGRRNSLGPAAEIDNDEWSVVEKTQLYSFTWPVGGMFIWLSIHFEAHPLYSSYAKSGELDRLAHGMWVLWTTKPYLALVSPGAMFSASPEINQREGWKCFRLCFVAIDEDELERASHGVADAVAAFWRIKDRKVIDKLIQADEDAVALEDGIVRMAHMC